MGSAVMYWRVFRILRWLCWVAAIAFFAEYLSNPSEHMNSFGHIHPGIEFWMFALPVAATFIGFAELNMRGRAGLAQPALGRNW